MVIHQLNVTKILNTLDVQIVDMKAKTAQSRRTETNFNARTAIAQQPMLVANSSNKN